MGWILANWELIMEIVGAVALIIGGPWALMLSKAAKQMGEMFNEQKQPNQDIKAYALKAGKTRALSYLRKRLA